MGAGLARCWHPEAAQKWGCLAVCSKGLLLCEVGAEGKPAEV